MYIYDNQLNYLLEGNFDNLEEIVEYLTQYHSVDWQGTIELEDFIKKMPLLEAINFLLDYGDWSIVVSDKELKQLKKYYIMDVDNQNIINYFEDRHQYDYMIEEFKRRLEHHKNNLWSVVDKAILNKLLEYPLKEDFKNWLKKNLKRYKYLSSSATYEMVLRWLEDDERR